MAAKKGKKKGTAAKRRTVVVVGKKHRKRRVSGTSHHKTKRRKRSVSGTSKMGLKQIAVMAVGVATGAAITHIILRPVEKKLTDKWPMVGKFLAAGEVFLGGYMALKAKGNFTKSLGVGILAGGVHGLMKQINVYKEIPRLMGTNQEFSDIRIPISGGFDKILAGILEDSRRGVRTEVVAGTKHTAIVADTDHTDMVTSLDEEAWYPTKGGSVVKGGW